MYLNYEEKPTYLYHHVYTPLDLQTNTGPITVPKSVLPGCTRPSRTRWLAAAPEAPSPAASLGACPGVTHPLIAPLCQSGLHAVTPLQFLHNTQKTPLTCDDGLPPNIRRYLLKSTCKLLYYKGAAGTMFIASMLCLLKPSAACEVQH